MTYVVSFDRSLQHIAHSTDPGLAFMSEAILGFSTGLVALGVAWIEFKKMPLVFGLPENLKVEAAIATGYKVRF